MDYFRILNLNREPFSNSPEPEFFFESSQHLGCLQKLELAIRLRRGLNVVTGHVGTGKTTLCRELLRKLAPTAEENQNIDTFLILDPSFTTPAEFLAFLAGLFGLPGEDTARPSEWQQKEAIKNHLFQKGVAENRIIVLIIDEGQKLPDFCREILRECLNYETNEFKLLQIVIFAQTEFKEILNQHVNFADRINLNYNLAPLSFRETIRMIRFRIEKASLPDPPPALFTRPAFWAVYHATRGYPRRIITLCHHVMLALIIQNRNQATRSLVRACAWRITPELAYSPRQIRWLPAAGWSFSIAVLVLLGYLGINSWPVFKAPPSAGVRPAGGIAAVTPVAVTPAAVTPAVSTPAPLPPSPESGGPAKKKPESLGTLTLRQSQVLWRRIVDVYGDYDPAVFSAITRANPQIRNPHRIASGAEIRFPALPAPRNPLPGDLYWVQVAAKGSLAEANEVLYSSPVDPPIRLFPYWNSREGLVFALLLKKGFTGEEAAREALLRLQPLWGPEAKVIRGWQPDTVFYARH